MTPDSDAAARLRERGYAVSDPPRDLCTCNHGEGMHRFGTREDATTGPRTRCSVVTPKGQCPCERYTPTEVPRGT